jgi:hypothetical protein
VHLAIRSSSLVESPAARLLGEARPLDRPVSLRPEEPWSPLFDDDVNALREAVFRVRLLVSA